MSDPYHVMRRATVPAILIVTGLMACGDDVEVSSQPTEIKSLTAYVGATLIDGRGGDAVANATILVQGDHIVAAGAGVDIPNGAEQVDLSGRWVVPGLVDAHVHYFESGRIYNNPNTIDLTGQVSWEEEMAWIYDRMPITLQTTLCAGVTSAISLGGPEVEYVAKALSQEMDNAPDVYAGHGPITPVPSNIIFRDWNGEPALRNAVTVEEAVEEIRTAVAKGADLIKLGELGSPFDSMEADYPLHVAAMIEEAERHGLPITMHLTSVSAYEKYLESGIGSIQHTPMGGDQLSVETAKALADKGIVVAPTLSVFKRSSVAIMDKSFEIEPIEQRCGDPQVIESWFVEVPEANRQDTSMWGPLLEGNRVNFRTLLEAGVEMAAASDAGNFGLLHGASLHYEIVEMVAAGMSPAQAIVAATFSSAKVAGIEDRVGSVETGKQADFLILTADPLADIRNLQSVESVVKSGKVFSQKDLLPPSDSISGQVLL